MFRNQVRDHNSILSMASPSSACFCAAGMLVQQQEDQRATRQFFPHLPPLPSAPTLPPHAPPSLPPSLQYDTDVTTWSPQGRLFQVEYAMEAVKQGSACVGLTSATHAVLAAIKRAPSELASHQQKVFKVDEHMGIAISGLTSDGRSLLK